MKKKIKQDAQQQFLVLSFWEIQSNQIWLLNFRGHR
jgi:hypothetical protein